MVRIFLALFAVALLHTSHVSAQVEMFPKNDALDVNPDTPLKLTFSSPPPLMNQGKIRVYDASNDALVDELDMSIPPGPRNTRTPAPYDTFKYSSVPDTVFTVKNPDTDTSHVYQKNYVGNASESSARHFFPVLVEGNTATITLHNNRLAYDKAYYVTVDAAVFPFQDGSFSGITGKSSWAFRTKSTGPAADSDMFVVAADGTGDFNTVQGVIDAMPDENPKLREIYVKNGTYEEIVVLRNKQNLIFHGQDRARVIVRYANNGVFNSAGRSELTISGGSGIHLVNLTIQSVGKDENPAQAEALYVKGDKHQVHNVTMLGSGDAVQIQASTRVFLSRSSIRGYGDNLLSYGAAFFKRCDLISTYGPHGWPRNPQTNHGDVFVESTFSLEGPGTAGDGHCTLARSPTSGVSFPYAEFVLINCRLQGIAPEGWGDAGPDYTNVHFWEYNSVGASDGKPVDVSKRVSYSRQLTMDKDAETIANYSNPTYVLDGWTPQLAPLIVTQPPDSLTVTPGESGEISADAVGEPEPSYQWLKDGQPLSGETSPALKLQAVAAAAAGQYAVRITNDLGMVMSNTTTVSVGAMAPRPAASGTSAQSGAGGVQPASAGAMLRGHGGAGAQSTPASTDGGDGPRAAGEVSGGAGAPGTSAGAQAARNEPQQSVRSGGGCSVGADRPDLGLCWMLLVAAYATTRRRRAS